jgi:hypothetical protein
MERAGRLFAFMYCRQIDPIFPYLLFVLFCFFLVLPESFSGQRHSNLGKVGHSTEESVKVSFTKINGFWTPRNRRSLDFTREWPWTETLRPQCSITKGLNMKGKEFLTLGS